MKTILLGMTGLCAGGAAYFMSDGPDFDRIVKKSPLEVYAAFSRLAQAGTVTPPGQEGPGPRISFKVDKVDGQSIHYEIQFDQRPVVEADLTFAPGGEDGRQTHMTAELEIDAFELGSAYRTEAGVALSMVPDRLIDSRFAAFMDDMVRDLEEGRPLPSLASRGMDGMGVRPSRVTTNAQDRRRQIEMGRREASRPQQSARPMVDPNAAADSYLESGRQDRFSH
jgi:hypothetical protein